MFSLFPLLPLEIRRKIWAFALPGPRVLKINDPNWFEQRISPASYGVHHPVILSVNRESREEALLHLTRIWDVYWNLHIDYLYFEHKPREICCHLLTDMWRKHELDLFENLAIDLRIWNERSIYAKYEHPTKIIKALPNIKGFAIVCTKHTKQEDIEQPYIPWRLGALTFETTFDPTYAITEESTWKDIEDREAEFGRRNDLNIAVLAIHDRARDGVPPDRWQTPKLWEIEYTFGK